MTGLVGYSLVQIFFLLEIVDYFVSAVIIPYIQAKAPHIGQPPVGLFLAIFLIGPLLGVIGDIVFGIAALRMRGQARLPGVLLIGGALALLGAGALPQPGIGGSVFAVAVLLNVVSFAWLIFVAGAADTSGVGAMTPVAQPVSVRG